MIKSLKYFFLRKDVFLKNTLPDLTQKSENIATEGSNDSVSNQEATTPATDVDTTNTGSYNY